MNGQIILNGKRYSSNGTPVKEVTLAQYLALPDTKKSDGIMYLIKDVANDGVGFPPLIYSTDEREVGVWYNGKPVYALTVHNDTLAPEVNIETNIADLSAYNIDTVVSIDATDHMIRSAGSVNRWMPNASYLETFYDPSSKYLKFRQSYAGSASNDLYITLLYTKTTDVAGQGKWTTDGVYARHYSTSEKVIGTWIDGKPLYEITYDTGSINAGSTKSVDISSLNIDYVSEIKGCGYSSQYNQSLPLPFVHSQSIYVISVNTVSSNANLQIATGSGVSLSKSSITIQYTKTTD